MVRKLKRGHLVVDDFVNVKERGEMEGAVKRSIASLILLLASFTPGLLGCSSDNGESIPATGGASAATAGTTAATGGAAATTGGTATVTGGAAAVTGGAGAATAGTTAATGGAAAEAGTGTGGVMTGTGGAAAQTGGTETPPTGDDAGPVDPTDGGTVQPPAGDTCLQGGDDFSQDGPYNVETTTLTIGSSGDYTIYIPDPLEEDCPHPMVSWGNGATIGGGTAYAHFNERMASWGIVTIASHDNGMGAVPNSDDGGFHRAAIDYLLAENENPSSQFYGKLSGRAGVSGHSLGGGRGNVASDHPNVEANGNVQGAGERMGLNLPDGVNVAFMCLTGTTDLAVEGCLNAVNSVVSSPAMYASYTGMGHTAHIGGSAGCDQYARLLSAWFRCFLADDADACAMFKGGENCPVCQEPGWDNIFVANY